MNMLAHLSSRKYDALEYVHQFVDHENEIATFYLFDEFGRWTGIQQYNPNSDNKKVDNCQEDGRYFTYNSRGELAVWGTENLTNEGSLIVTESVFKSAAVHMAGFNSVTQLTAGVSKRFVDFVHSLNPDPVFVGDNDKAGLRFSTKYSKSGFVTEKDLDEYSTEELRELLLSKGLTPRE